MIFITWCKVDSDQIYLLSHIEAALQDHLLPVAAMSHSLYHQVGSSHPDLDPRQYQRVLSRNLFPSVKFKGHNGLMGVANFQLV